MLGGYKLLDTVMVDGCKKLRNLNRGSSTDMKCWRAASSIDREGANSTALNSTQLLLSIPGGKSFQSELLVCSFICCCYVDADHSALYFLFRPREGTWSQYRLDTTLSQGPAA